jgi:alkanesulfonate monooxygenase SsuD/methylene tetrahydromethanopterin reductase-like flavin-dependent oxidoreductase (luciferase family)
MTFGGKIGFSLGPLLTAEELLACAKIADSSGKAHSIWVPESWGRESFATLGAVSQVTSNVKLGTSIVSIFSRTPGTVAMAGTTLDALSSGRAMIGLGASTEAIVENWHGVKFERPLERMGEFLQCLRKMISGERVNFDGKYFRAKNFKLLHAPVRQSIPLFVGAVNRGMISLATSLADGVILYLRPLDELQKTASEIKQTASANEFEIACSIICAVSDSDPDKARKRAAQTLAFYVAVGRYYRDFLSRNGFATEAEKILRTYSTHGMEPATACVSDEMLRALTICGTRNECRDGLARFVSAGVTLPIVQFNPVGGTESSFRELLSTF